MNKSEKEFKSLLYPRVKVSPLATGINSDVDNNRHPFPEDDVLSRFFANEVVFSIAEAKALYQKGKKERFACAAIRDNVILDRALLGREEFPLSRSDPYADLFDGMVGTLDAHYRIEIDRIKEGVYGQAPLEAVNRLSMWQKLYDFVPGPIDGIPGMIEGTSIMQPPDSNEDFIGLATGLKHMASLLKVIPRVLKRDLPKLLPSTPITLTPRIMHSAAVSNFHLVGEVAMMDHDAFTAIETTLYGDNSRIRSRELRSEDLILTEFSDGAARIDFAPTVWDKALVKLRKFREYAELTGLETTAGCSFMARVGKDRSGMLKLWNWNTDIGLHIYQTYEARMLLPWWRRLFTS